MARWYYHYAGLHIASELCLPEWRAFEQEQLFRTPDVEILLESAPAREPLLRLTAEEYCFKIEEVGDYFVQGGRLIRIAMHPDAGQREARLFLLGSAWGVLCYQRGLLALHASVVQVQGEAIAFCGASGAGKSSLAAWLVAQGYRLIGDDLCHFELSGTKPSVHPAAPRLKLWQNALTELGWENEGLERDHFRMDKFHIYHFLTPQRQDSLHLAQPALLESTGSTPVPLRAIYLLAWGELSIIQLKGLDALYQLIESATYRGELLEPMGMLAAHWQRCFNLARTVPIFKFTRPADWSEMDAAMKTLLDLWQKVP